MKDWLFTVTSIETWKTGIGGFGFGLWRNDYDKVIIWTFAIGPITVYASRMK